MSGLARQSWRVQLRLDVALAVLWTERLGAAFWPAASLAIALTGLAVLVPAGALPLWLHLPLLGAALAGLGLLAVRGAAGLARPGADAAERRLERDSGLAHRPFAVLRDRPAALTDDQAAAWRAHRERAAASLARLRLRGPKPVLAGLDPFAIRAASVLVLAAGLVVAGPMAGERLAASFFPGLPGLLAGPAVTVQAWAQPPGYTGMAPVFLPASGGDVTVPAGSKLSVSLTGGGLRPHLSAPGVSAKFQALGHESYQAAAVLDAGGTLRITRFFGTVSSWTLTVLPNDAPVASWAEPPAGVAKSVETRLPWKAAQRWGVASLEAELRPDGRPDLPARHVRIALPGTPKDGHGVATADLSADPYAGLKMSARLLATDVSGQHGMSEAALFTLPARAFRNPMARAIAELRRRLALHPDARDDAANDLAVMAQAPQGAQGTAGITLNLAAVAALLVGDRTAHGLDEAQARLWTIALALDGALPDAAQRALAQAREDMHRALDDRARGKIPDAELSKRLDALKQALDKRLQDIAKKAIEQGALQNFDPKRDHLTSNAMDRLMRKMEEAARAGRMDEAKQDMAQLERMMDQLNSAHVMNREQAQQQEQASKRGRQMMGAVQDMVKRETTLMDHAQARAPGPAPELPQQFRNFDFQRQEGTEDPDPGTPASPLQPPPPAYERPDETHGPAQEADARTQRALHRALDALQQGLKQGGVEPPKKLDAAGSEMDQAAGALKSGQEREAASSEARVIADLQQGGRDMAKQMSRGAGPMQLSLAPGGRDTPGGEGGDEESGEQDDHGRDPLGRRVDGNGKPGDDPNLHVPDQMEQGRSRAIQDELRRRGADRARPQEELDYIDRLLKTF